jgi:hypothetical protein
MVDSIALPSLIAGNHDHSSYSIKLFIVPMTHLSKVFPLIVKMLFTITPFSGSTDNIFKLFYKSLKYSVDFMSTLETETRI